VIEEFVENATLSRFAQPNEIASVASFLASDESSYMSASFVSVDGGGNTGRYPNLPKAFGQI
jgi:3-oxoacyl-[acyl-carrier protein] reductase